MEARMQQSVSAPQRRSSRRRRISAAELARLAEEACRHVPSVARRYVGRGVSFDDLVGAGHLGVVRAAYRFDPTRGVKFASYAAWWIRKELLAAIERSPLVSAPRYAIQRRRRILAADGPAGVERLGFSPVQIRHALSVGTGAALSLDAPVAENGSSLAECLVERRDAGPEAHLLAAELSRRLRAALGELSSKERFVLDQRFGLNGNGGLSATLDDVGRMLGISGERVRQIEAGALRRIRKALRPGRRPSSSPTRS